MICTFCGDPATGLCERKHRQWTIVQPSEILAGDILMRPDGTIYAVARVSLHKSTARHRPHFPATQPDPLDEYIIETKQKRRFLILYPNLPVLVKRDVICGWPRCELHCGKCIGLAHDESERERMLQSAEEPRTEKETGEERKHREKKRRKMGLPVEAPVPKRKSLPRERKLY